MLHADFNIEGPVVVKFLPQRLDGETCCAILNYRDPEAARWSLAKLQGVSMRTPSGVARYLCFRYAVKKGQKTAFENSYQPESAVPTPALTPAQQALQQATAAAHGLDPDTFAQYSLSANQVAASVADFDSFSAMPSLYVSDLPMEWTEDNIRALCLEVGLDPVLIVAIKFLPQRIQALSRCALFRFTDMEIANTAAKMLAGHQVTLSDGTPRGLHARIAEKRRELREPANPGRPEFGELDQGTTNTSLPSTDLYVTEVPADWTEEMLHNLHAEVGVDADRISQIKLLPRRHASYPTGAAIIRYVDTETAAHSKGVLEGYPVSIPGGQRSLITRYADPPRKGGSKGRR